MESTITRRSFIGAVAAGAAAGAAGAAGATLSAGDAHAAEAGEIGTLDPIAEFAQTVGADVVVLGGGTSGFVTAVSAAEEGLNVALVTASSKPISRGGSNFAVYSKAMEALGVPKASPDLFHKEIAMEANAVDQAKWYKLYNNSETAMNWLIDIMAGYGAGVVLECDNNIAPDDIYYVGMAAHGFTKGDITSSGLGQSIVVNGLAEKLLALGGSIYYSHVGVQLVRGEDGKSGRVTAVVARDPQGAFVRFDAAKAVVLATGDFSADRTLMERYSPWAATLITDEVYDSEPDYDKEFFYGGLYKGDGQKMGLQIGAAWQKINPVAPSVVTAICGPVQNAAQNYFGLLVNRDGKRFSNEYASCTLGFLSNWMQPGNKAYAIWGLDYLNSMDEGWYPAYPVLGMTKLMSKEEVVASWDASAAAGNYVKFDTVEEVVEALGLPVEETMKTVERYNELCRNGEDVDFYKRSDAMVPIETGPFYGQASFGPLFLCTLGGLRTNSDLQVCDANDDAIPGLYNVGTMTGDFYAGQYTFQIPGLNYGGTCLTFGYLTGKFIAENE